MRYKEYLEKARILARETKIDILHACYNKATSALWFAVEALFRALLNQYRQPIPWRSGTVITRVFSFAKSYGLLMRGV